MARLQLVVKAVMNMSSFAASAWQAPRLDIVEPVAPEPLSEAEIQQIKADAEKAGFEQGQLAGHEAGMQAGLAAGKAEGLALYEERAAAFLGLLESVDQPIAQMDEQLAVEISQLAAMIGAELARREITFDRERLVEQVLHIAKVLPVHQHPPEVFLNPEDKQIVSDFVAALDPAHPAHSWPLFEDASIERGDCRMQGRDSAIDARLTQMALDLVKTAFRSEGALDV